MKCILETDFGQIKILVFELKFMCVIDGWLLSQADNGTFWIDWVFCFDLGWYTDEFNWKGNYVPRYELFVRTQNIFSGSTMASAWIGVMSTSHHSSIVAQYHHNLTKLSILLLAMGIIASTAGDDDDVNNGFVALFRFRSLFVVDSMKNKWMVAFIPPLHIINFAHSLSFFYKRRRAKSRTYQSHSHRSST